LSSGKCEGYSLLEFDAECGDSCASFFTVDSGGDMQIFQKILLLL
jgi:hypothetical protein